MRYLFSLLDPMAIPYCAFVSVAVSGKLKYERYGYKYGI
jgi:hypothetical protein